MISPQVTLRVAGPDDLDAVAALRALWEDTADHGAEVVQLAVRLAEWLAAEGDRRTIWLAARDGQDVGMASLFEYRRMPRPGRLDSRWGYVGNMFVRAEDRNRGVGSALLSAIVATAEQRGYVRLVLSPTARAIPLYRRAGFVPAGEEDGELLLVRPAPATGSAG
jgi:GNAT superfamily N-acetyltransferase